MAEGNLDRGARRRSIPEAERRKVWVRSGGRCAVCNADLMEGRLTRREFALGDLAHIVGQHHTAGSPRGLADLPKDERDKADNLMLICKGDHAEIDRAGSLDLMTVEKLRKLKRDHEDRIRYLTGLAPDRSTVVLRMVGRVRGNAVELTRDSATMAILRSSDRFPDYRLCLDRHGIEIDLRQLPGEPVADDRYYAAAKAAIDEVIDHKVVEGVARENIAHLSVFAFARIPLLVYLGSRLDDTIPTEIYQRHRAGERWDWPHAAKASDFVVQSPTSHAGASEAVLVLNVSGTIQSQELPANLLDLPTFVLQPDGELPHPDVMASRKTLQAFETKVRSLLSGLEAAGKSIRRLHVFPALSLSAAIVLGRVVDPPRPPDAGRIRPNPKRLPARPGDQVKLLDYFKTFLDSTVNLNQTRLNLLDQRVQAIVSCLEDDSVIGTLIEDHIPQGSWAHRTIIRPLPGDEFDADFLLLLTEVDDWSASPKLYLSELRAAFRRSSTYRDMVHRKNRCVRIGYAGDCHIDVVPHLRLADGRQVIVNWAEDKFEDTNPEGFTAWMREKDELANGNLRKVIRLLKFLRDYKNTFTVPSVILTTLLGERVQAWDAENRYCDVPTTLKNVIADLDAWLDLHLSMPTVEDPSCPGSTFNHRWDEDDYSNFKERIAYYSDKITSAYEETGQDKSLALWQEVFGSEFRRSAREAGSDLAKVSTRAVRHRDPGEEFIDEQPGLTLAGGYRVRIECKVERRAGFRHGNLRQLRSVGKGRTLRFRIVDCDVPEPFQVWWKVKNRGAEAAVAGDLRGTLLRDDGSRSRVENTRYYGRHYIECYIVKNGRVLATDHHTVNIT